MAEGVAWRRRPWGDAAPPRQTVMLNTAMIGRLAQRLRAREWARAAGRRTGAPPRSDLEIWAERWSRNQQIESEGLPGQRRQP